MDSAKGFLMAMIIMLPTLLISTTGVILSIIYRKRMGRVWTYSLAAFAIFLFSGLLSVTHQIIFYFYIIPESKYSEYQAIAPVFSGVAMLLSIAGFSLLFVALFSKRDIVTR